MDFVVHLYLFSLFEAKIRKNKIYFNICRNLKQKIHQYVRSIIDFYFVLISNESTTCGIFIFVNLRNKQNHTKNSIQSTKICKTWQEHIMHTLQNERKWNCLDIGNGSCCGFDDLVIILIWLVNLRNLFTDFNAMLL